MTFISVLRQWLSVASCAAPLLLISPLLHAQTSTTSLPPAKTYFVDQGGQRIGIKERWSEDANGERHGRYLLYNKNGVVIESLTFVHGVQTGAGYSYYNSNAKFFNPYQLRPDTKFAGNYRAGRKVGTWTASDDKTGGLVKKVQYDEAGQVKQQVNYDAAGVAGPALDRYGVEISNAEPSAAPRPVKQANASPAKANNLEDFGFDDAAVAAAQAKLSPAEKAYKLLDSFSVLGFQNSFLVDAQVLTPYQRTLLDDIIKNIKACNQGGIRIDTVTVSTHTAYLNPSAKDYESRLKQAYITTLLRARLLEEYLRSNLSQEGVIVEAFGCADQLLKKESDLMSKRETSALVTLHEDRVQIGYNVHLPNAKSKYVALRNRFSLLMTDSK